jgi:hypothetical protein
MFCPRADVAGGASTATVEMETGTDLATLLMGAGDYRAGKWARAQIPANATHLGQPRRA